MGILRSCLVAALVLVVGLPAMAENAKPFPGTQVIETGKPFGAFVKNLLAAAKANKMGIVGHACATCGAKNIGKTNPGNRVIMIFNPHFAVRMLAASEAAGIEAPLRLYVTEQSNCQARLTYRLPSAVFGAYDVADLDAMGKELDAIFATIVKQALK
jgi:uncharacterized protein (DUF302 family)